MINSHAQAEIDWTLLQPQLFNYSTQVLFLIWQIVFEIKK